jgi:PAS domain S-box-containing protein
METHKILIIDDEKDILTSIKRLFYDRDELQIFTSLSGKEGLEILKNNNIDIVISDQIMPEMSGVEFLAQVNRGYPHTIRMLLTGNADIDSAIDAINSGHIYRYLSKPWNDEDFILTINKAIEFLNLRNDNIKLINSINKKNEELKENMDWFYSILKSIGEGVITTDFLGKVTFINPVAEGYSGFSQKNAVGRNLTEVFYVLEGKQILFSSYPISKFIEDGLCIKKYKNMTLINKNGVEIPIEFKLSPIMDEEGHITGKGVVITFHED